MTARLSVGDPAPLFELPDADQAVARAYGATRHGMTACTERHTAAPNDDIAGEGQKGGAA